MVRREDSKMSNEQEYKIGDCVEIELFSGGRAELVVQWNDEQYVGGKLDNGRGWSRRYEEVKLISRAPAETYAVGELVQISGAPYGPWGDAVVTAIGAGAV